MISTSTKILLFFGFKPYNENRRFNFLFNNRGQKMTKKEELKNVCELALKRQPTDEILNAYFENIVKRSEVNISDDELSEYINEININYLQK